MQRRDRLAQPRVDLDAWQDARVGVGRAQLGRAEGEIDQQDHAKADANHGERARVDAEASLEQPTIGLARDTHLLRSSLSIIAATRPKPSTDR